MTNTNSNIMLQIYPRTQIFGFLLNTWYWEPHFNGYFNVLIKVGGSKCNKWASHRNTMMYDQVTSLVYHSLINNIYKTLQLQTMLTATRVCKNIFFILMLIHLIKLLKKYFLLRDIFVVERKLGGNVIPVYLISVDILSLFLLLWTTLVNIFNVILEIFCNPATILQLNTCIAMKLFLYSGARIH